MSLTTIKLALAVVGLATFFVGYRMQQQNVQYLGIGFVLVAFLLRFLDRPKKRPEDELLP
jgi:hypothetical protein